MSDLIKTLHPQNNIEDNVYPNIIADNIPDSSISSSKLDSTLLTTINNKANSSDISDKKITITQNGVTKGSFTLNQTSNSVIALDNGSSMGLVVNINTNSTTSDLIPLIEFNITNDNYNYENWLWFDPSSDDNVVWIGEGSGDATLTIKNDNSIIIEDIHNITLGTSSNPITSINANQITANQITANQINTTDEKILIIQQTELTLTIEKTNFCQYEIPEEYSDYIIKMFQDSTDTPYYIKLNQTYDGHSLGVCQSTITLPLKKITTYLYKTNTLELSNCYLVALFGDVDLTNYETKTYNFFTIKFDSSKNLFYLYTPFKILNEYSENTITILKKNIY